MKKILFTMGLVFVLLIAGITPTSAAIPTVEVINIDDHSTMDCGDFTVSVNSKATLTFTYFWNNDGTLDKYHIHGEWQETYTNPNNGKSILSNPAGYNLFEDVDDKPGTIKLTGVMFHVVIPGKGTVIIDAGYIIGDYTHPIIVKGNHQINYNGGYSYDIFCDYLR